MKLDATMQIYYNRQNLSDEEADNIIDASKRCGNRATEL